MEVRHRNFLKSALKDVHSSLVNLSVFHSFCNPTGGIKNKIPVRIFLGTIPQSK